MFILAEDISIIDFPGQYIRIYKGFTVVFSDITQNFAEISSRSGSFPLEKKRRLCEYLCLCETEGYRWIQNLSLLRFSVISDLF